MVSRQTARRRDIAVSLGLLLVAWATANPSFGQFRQGATPPKKVAPFSYVAQNLASMYQAVTIVTGSDRRYRGVGFARCLRIVLAKVSGNPRLVNDPRVERFAAEANLFVASFDYVDQDAAYHIKDDQGTYDRPFNLTVRFVPAMIDRLLEQLGDRPWRGDRPVIVPVITVRGVTTTYVLSAEIPAGADQRNSLEEVASEFGLRVRFPTDAELTSWGLTSGGILSGSIERPADWAFVIGTLEFKTAVPGWTGSWKLRYQAHDHVWGISGVNFDKAFQNLAAGVAQVASGHGAPR
jgi:hypothetical protein